MELINKGLEMDTKESITLPLLITRFDKKKESFILKCYRYAVEGGNLNRSEYILNNNIVEGESFIDLIRSRCNYCLSTTSNIPGSKRTKAEQANNFKIKQKLLGVKSKIDFEILGDDNVMLTNVECTDSNEDIIIPKFITSIRRPKIKLTRSREIDSIDSVFNNVVCNSIRIEANISDMSYLLCGIIDIVSGIIDFCGNEPASLAGFLCYSKVARVEFRNIRGNNLTDASLCFCNCSNLLDIILPFTDLSNLRFLVGSFYGCHNLKGIQYNKLKLPRLEDITSLLNGCSSIKLLDLSILDTCKPRFTSYAFGKCNILDVTSIENLNLSRTERSEYMFYSSRFKVKELNISNWNTHRLLNAKGMFCSTNLQEIYCGELDLRNLVDASDLFSCNLSLQEIDISKVKVRSIKDISGMFENCFSLNEVKFWDNSNVKEIESIGAIFNGCKCITHIDLNSIDLRNVRSYSMVFKGCISIRSMDLSNCLMGEHISLDSTFEGCNCLREIKFPTIDDIGHRIVVKSATFAFKDCFELEKLDLRAFDVTGDTKKMFDGCLELKEVLLIDLTDETWGDGTYTVKFTGKKM